MTPEPARPGLRPADERELTLFRSETSAQLRLTQRHVEFLAARAGSEQTLALTRAQAMHVRSNVMAQEVLAQRIWVFEGTIPPAALEQAAARDEDYALLDIGECRAVVFLDPVRYPAWLRARDDLSQVQRVENQIRAIALASEHFFNGLLGCCSPDAPAPVRAGAQQPSQRDACPSRPASFRHPRSPGDR